MPTANQQGRWPLVEANNMLPGVARFWGGAQQVVSMLNQHILFGPCSWMNCLPKSTTISM